MPADYSAIARARREYADKIVSHAMTAGLDTTRNKVLRQYRVWVSWHEGRLATGYLIKQTGVKKCSIVRWE
jgi:hypothetical protein